MNEEEYAALNQSIKDCISKQKIDQLIEEFNTDFFKNFICNDDISNVNIESLYFRIYAHKSVKDIIKSRFSFIGSFNSIYSSISTKHGVLLLVLLLRAINTKDIEIADKRKELFNDAAALYNTDYNSFLVGIESLMSTYN